MLTATLTPTETYQNILQQAKLLYDQDPDWVTFFREVLGVDGVVRQAFSNLDDLTAFEKSEQFEQIQKWIVRLREKRTTTDTEVEPTRVITVRLPRSMHEYLKTEAHDLRTSMNKLCISKLLQVIEQDMIPTERGGSTPRRQTTPSVSVGPTLSTNHASTNHAGTNHAGTNHAGTNHVPLDRTPVASSF